MASVGISDPTTQMLYDPNQFGGVFDPTGGAGGAPPPNVGQPTSSNSGMGSPAGAPQQFPDQQSAMQYAIGTLGLQGQQAVDWLQQNYPQFNTYGSGVSYNPADNTFGGSGWYAAPGTDPNAQFGFDWITRAGGGSAAPGAAPTTGGVGGGTTGPFTPSTPTSTWSPDPRTNDLYNTLLGRSNTSLDISGNDPIIRNLTDNFQATEARQQKSYLNDLAEKEGGTGNLGMEQRMSSEKIAQDTAGYQGQLENNELMQRRQIIQDSLNQMGSLLSDQEKMDLQNQLAIMDNLLGQAGLQQGAYQFDQTLGFNTSPLGAGATA